MGWCTFLLRRLRSGGFKINSNVGGVASAETFCSVNLCFDFITSRQHLASLACRKDHFPPGGSVHLLNNHQTTHNHKSPSFIRCIPVQRSDLGSTSKRQPCNFCSWSLVDVCMLIRPEIIKIWALLNYARIREGKHRKTARFTWGGKCEMDFLLQKGCTPINLHPSYSGFCGAISCGWVSRSLDSHAFLVRRKSNNAFFKSLLIGSVRIWENAFSEERLKTREEDNSNFLLVFS